ncbi:MAG: GerMN domain-containing protein [Acidobacteriota bacterium]|nr:MAG: GerMN domain-containing protein [Acidobacteriota bacterium]
MNRKRAVGLGVLLGSAAGLLVLLVVLSVKDGSEPVPTPLAPPPPVAADEDAAPGVDEPTVRTQPVAIYQRAASERLALVAVPAQIIWMASPVDRARQIVRLVLEGVPESGALRPTREKLRYREVLIDASGIAWVDLAGEPLSGLTGSDAEQALVGCLARSLVENLDEVRRVGIVVDGEPRQTLAGHVDLSLTFTGREWPSLDQASARRLRRRIDGAPS